jgi:membrane associated rhomboid family serine protease
MLPLHDDQPRERVPFATLFLIFLNFLVFIGWQLQAGIPESIEIGAMIPADFNQSPSPDNWIHLASSMFMHGGWMHILGNMWFLWIFGANVEDVIGSGRFALFYVLCGAAAGFVYVAFSPESLLPMIGASGAVSGVLGAYLILHPKASITTFVPIIIFFKIIRVRAWFFLVVWIGFQILSQATSAQKEGGVAYLAHIGGFFSGILLIFFFKKARQ